MVNSARTRRVRTGSGVGRVAFDPDVPLLEHIAAQRPKLRKSEQAVADLIQADPAPVVGATMASLAEAAGVSEPTVMRFCTSLGFEGFQQFKLQLAQSLALGLPPTHSAIRPDDSVADVATKVFDHTISSLDRSRRSLDAVAVERAVQAILDAPSLLIAGLGASGLIADDAAQKAVLFGIPVAAPPDPHQQFMAAAMAPPASVLLAVSNTGRTSSVLDVVNRGRESGMTVVSLTGDADSPLARRADISIVARTFEDTDRFTPSVSRIAGLVVVDVLATAVSLRRGPEHARRLSAMKDGLTAFRSARRN